MIEVLTGACEVALRSVQTHSIDCVVTSPPYNLGVDYQGYTDERNDYKEWLTHVFTELVRVVKDDGHFFLQVGGTNKDPLLPMRVLGFALDGGWVLQNQILWVKSVTINNESHGHFKPITSPRYLNHTYEYIFHLTKTGQVPIDRLAVGVPYQDKSNIARFGSEGRPDKRCGGDVWYIPYETIRCRALDRANHPATFPTDLPLRCMKLTGKLEGKVLDPFLGIGTTLIAAKHLGWDGVGVEIVPEVADAAKERIASL